MIVETTRYARTPFYVEAVQVTEDNLVAVAAWCKGSVIRNKNVSFIKVDVLNPLTERQTKAFVGDWVLLAETGNGFKVYTTKAFDNNFELASGEVSIHTVPDPTAPVQEAMSFVDVEPGIPDAMPTTAQEALANLPEGDVVEYTNGLLTRAGRFVFKPGLPDVPKVTATATNPFSPMAEAFHADRKVNRDAGTGEFVTEEYAKEHPETTVSETVEDDS